MFHQNGDTYTYRSGESQIDTSPKFYSKQWSYMIDTNAGNYESKQVIFDLSGFYNSAKFLSPREMILVMPINVVLSASGISTSAGAALSTGKVGSGLGAAARLSRYAFVGPAGRCDSLSGCSFDNFAQVTDQFAIGCKSGYWQFIQSIQFQLDGKDVIQLTPNINFHCSFKANTSWSQSDVEKHGAILGFYPDSHESWMFLDGHKVPASGNMFINSPFYAQGSGIVNNRLPPDGVMPLYPSLVGSTQELYAQNDAAGAFTTRIQEYTSVVASRAFTQAPNAARGPNQMVDASGVSTQSYYTGSNKGFYQRMKWTNKFDPSMLAGLTSSFCAGVQQVKQELDLDLENRLVCSPQTFFTAVADQWPVPSSYIHDSELFLVNEDSIDATSYRQILITGVIRFKDICDLFGKLPPTRGLYMRILVNLNTGAMRIGNGLTGNASAFPNISATTYDSQLIDLTQEAYSYYTKITENTFPGTCPLMIAPLVPSAAAYQYSTTATDVAANSQGVGSHTIGYNLQMYPGMAVDSGSRARSSINLSVSLAKPDLSVHKQLTAPPGASKLANCRIYVPSIEFEPSIGENYIRNFKDQVIKYNDVLQFVYKVSKGHTSFNYQIANGVTNAKRLVIIPMYDEAQPSAQALPGTSYVLGGTTSYSSDSLPKCYEEARSPFDSFPGTTAPQCELTDMNILISNQNVWMRNISYSFENFIEEMSEANAINGGLATGLTSGLIDYDKWCNNYRYYVVDLSRRLAGDNTPKSLTLQASSNFKIDVTLYIFVEYERTISLNVETGHLNATSN